MSLMNLSVIYRGFSSFFEESKFLEQKPPLAVLFYGKLQMCRIGGIIDMGYYKKEEFSRFLKKTVSVTRSVTFSAFQSLLLCH